MSSWGQRCGCRNHTANTNVGCPYNVKSGVCDNCEKYCTVRDERSEESAVKTEGRPFYKCKCGDVFKQTGVCPHTDKKYVSGEEFKAISDERSEESVVKAERTRIIKALEELKENHAHYEYTCLQFDPIIDIAIKAVEKGNK